MVPKYFIYFTFCIILPPAILGSGLYTADDQLYNLDNLNYKGSLLGSQTAWVIEFYSSWCGHCIHFAPTWKSFAKDVKDWNHTIKVGAIDCANDDNIDICREYEIMGYPSVRLFSSDTKKGNIGVDLKARTIDTMRHSLIDFIVEQQQLGNSSKTWMNLLNYKGEIKDLLTMNDKENGVLILEKNASYVGRETVLDLGKQNTIYLRRNELDDQAFNALGLGSKSVRAVAFVKKTGEMSIKSAKSRSRQKLVQFILHFLKTETTDSPISAEDLEGAGDGRPDEFSTDRLENAENLPNSALSTTQAQVYMVDIENTIGYALQHEVAIQKEISGEQLLALQNFIHATIKYLPLRSPVHNFLLAVREYVTSRPLIKGEEFSRLLVSLNGSDSIIPDHQPWVGCLGSKVSFRGYPCGLWTTFHTMTVNAPSESSVIKDIHGFVKYLFGCNHCSNHFHDMYVNDSGHSVITRDDSIKWLWKAHNKVNKRLHGDISEDPSHIKQQFPTKLICPKCWINEEFVDNAVTDYLKVLYSKNNISLQGTRSIPYVNSKNRQARVYQELNLHNGNEMRDIPKLKDFANNYKSPNSSSSNVWGFNTTDINLCVILYGISTVIVVFVYFVVVIRRKRRRQTFVQTHKNV